MKGLIGKPASGTPCTVPVPKKYTIMIPGG